MKEELKNELLKCIEDYRTEKAHTIADDILVKIALNIYFSKEERKELVDLYLKVPKWYA